MSWISLLNREGIIACRIRELPVGDARGAEVMSNEEDPAR
jgi:hypothetical protein